jgi:hypothetical protein
LAVSRKSQPHLGTSRLISVPGRTLDLLVRMPSFSLSWPTSIEVVSLLRYALAIGETVAKFYGRFYARTMRNSTRNDRVVERIWYLAKIVCTKIAYQKWTKQNRSEDIASDLQVYGGR